jgi:hypothetical protein
MAFDKQQILDLLKARGDHQHAAQADQELPDQVDPDQHSDILSKYGINPSEVSGLLKGLGGKLGL